MQRARVWTRPYAVETALTTPLFSHAQYSLGEYQKAVEAYEAGLKLDPSNASMKQTLGVCKNKLAEQNSTAVSDREPVAGGAGAGASGMPDLSSLASMLGGGGGGMPDIASMMRNPQMMAMCVESSTGRGGVKAECADALTAGPSR